MLPQMEDMIAAVEWRMDRRSHTKTRATMAYTKHAVHEGRIGVIFPSGRVAKRRGLRLYERPWMSSPVTLARKFDLPIIPVRTEAQNSALFYLFDMIHPSLRDIIFFHETLNKDRQPFQVQIGVPILPADLPAKSDDALALLSQATLSHASKDTERALGGTVPLFPMWSSRPLWT